MTGKRHWCVSVWFISETFLGGEGVGWRQTHLSSWFLVSTREFLSLKYVLSCLILCFFLEVLET